MLVILDTLDLDTIKAVALEMHNSTGRLPLVNPEDGDFLNSYVPGSEVDAIFTGYGRDADTDTLRYADMYLASLGARHWGTKKSVESPVYAGSLETPAANIVIDALYAENRSSLFKARSVKYVGTTYTDPKFVVVVDNKKGDHSHSPANSEIIRNLLLSSPEDFWKDLGAVSAGNVDSLGEFLYMIEYSIPITFTSGGRSKLRHLGIPFLEHREPTADEKYGIELREAANRFSYQLSLS